MSRLLDFRFVLCLGTALFLAFLIAGVVVARDEVPPMIVAPSAHVTTPAPVVVPAVVADRHTQPADGPMCQQPLEPEATPPTYLDVLLAEPANDHEYALIEAGIKACARLRGPVGKTSDPYTALALLRLETEVGAPEGFFLGTWCVEASMRAAPVKGTLFHGDYRDGVPLASGPLQLHENVWRTSCGGIAAAPHDLLWAARCYWSVVLRTTEKARKLTKCAESEILRVSEAAVANIRRYGWRCRKEDSSAHWRMAGLIQSELRATHD